jgi:CRP-like cAMP-binding protein
MSSKDVVLKTGDMVFNEGDQSKSLYFVKRGVVRIFKKKGVGAIEIESIRAGQVLGELAFFDNQPRSASAEALTQVELVEISKAALEDAISKVPDWFSALIKTITSRLRNTNNRLRALESVSTDYETDKYGNRSREFTYVNSSELLKFCTALLLVSSRYGKQSPEGVEFSLPLLEKFASQIMQIGASKVFSLVEVFKITKIISEDSKIKDIKFLDQMIQFLNDQNLVEPTKKRTLTEMGFKILQMIADSKESATKVSDTLEQVNVAPLIFKANLNLNQVQELFDQSFIQNINMVSGNEAYAQYEPAKLALECKIFWMLNEVTKLNESKRKGNAS